ncbi:hypothetical protein [Marinobacter sp. CHS3-4]|uniref:hypothetical protein n=1 Tax=Marinobacter sp. CHS3-4 TaxID=3045174 RepID=UPI0024B518C5|nr:hypothetical protein [Marinobacter sp. CHS3-4]MDI9246948.1 hypothetical protein [Marinobacter sp. CHS3-4]
MNKDAFKFASANNLDWLVKFHNHVKALFGEAQQEIDDLEDQHLRKFWSDVYSNQFPKSLRTAVFLMMFGHIEEMLILLSKGKDVAPDSRLGGLEKYKPIVKEALGDEIAQFEPWQFLMEAAQIRNTILHSAGRPSLMRKPEKVEQIIQKRSNCYHLKMDRIEIRPEGLRLLANYTRDFIDRLNQ